MGEHKAAAHIYGFYALGAAILSGVLGVIGGWYLKDASQTPQSQPAASSVVQPPPSIENPATKSEPQSKPESKINFGDLLRRKERKQADAEPTEITMAAE